VAGRGTVEGEVDGLSERNLLTGVGQGENATSFGVDLDRGTGRVDDAELEAFRSTLLAFLRSANLPLLRIF